MIILDTNVLSELMKPEPSSRVVLWVGKQARAEIFTTSITESEIFYGIELLARGKRREVLMTAAEAIFSVDLAERVLPFEGQSARAFSRIAVRRRALGKPISHEDAQIAAICLVHGAKLATGNAADFLDCEVDVVDPWKEA